jgi:hypothetical protein
LNPPTKKLLLVGGWARLVPQPAENKSFFASFFAKKEVLIPS